MIAQEADNFAQRTCFNRIQTGCRFVQANHFRRGTHRTGDFQPALLTVRHFPCQPVGTIHQFHHFQPVKCAVQRLIFRTAITRRIEHTGNQVAVGLHVLSDQQIFNHRHFTKQPDILKGTRQPGAVNQVCTAEHFVENTFAQLRWFYPVIRLKFLPEHLDYIGRPAARIEQNIAAGRFIKTCQAIKYRGFSCAVRADQRGNRSAFHRKIHIVQRLNAAEMHAQMLDTQDVVIR
ncbi:hypothetical protein SRABI106_03928 [Rahnella aquatilis]|nr:hypothetical protein SRABI106_03928 [Rahnella aquatilis]